MEAPYIITSLPKPLDAQNGRAYAAAVFGLRGSRKRKRHEVAIGIDGESVNIYNVQNQTSVASHALPPQSYLCCSPCSIYCRSSDSTSSQRRTYLALKDGRADKKRRLVCLVNEDSRGSHSLGAHLSAPSKRECKLRSEEIVAVDILPSHTAESGGSISLGVVVTYRSGSVDCFARDLSQLLWKFDAVRVASIHARQFEVEYAVAVDLNTARKGLLAGRDDLVAALQHAAPGTPITTVWLQCHCVQDTDSRRLLLYTIRPQVQPGRKSGVDLIMDVELPLHGRLSPRRANYDLHAASGKLYQLCGDFLTIFDLSGTVPQIQKVFGSRAEPVLNFVRLSSACVLTSSSGKLSLYETKYGSVQSSIPLPLPRSMDSESKKRKRAEGEADAFEISSYISFSDLDIVVGLSSDALLAFQARETSRGSKRSKNSGALLIDVFGKGDTVSGGKSTANAKLEDKQEAEWVQWKAEADAAVAKNDDIEFEMLVARTLRLESTPIPADTRQLLIEAGEGVEGPPDLERSLTVESFDDRHIDRRRAGYLLGNCFRIASEEERAASWHGHLFIHTVASANTLRYFALTGFLSAESLSRALILSSAHHMQFRVGPGDVMDAIGRFDTDFDLMNRLLTIPVHWDVAEMVQAVKILSESFESILGSRSQTLRALTFASQGDGDADVPTTNGDVDTTLEYELRAAEFALNHAFAELDSSPESLREILYEIFRRLDTFPRKTIVTYLRKMLSHQDLIRFVSALRLELALGGWISRYIDYQDDEENDSTAGTLKTLTKSDTEDTFSSPSDSAVSVVASLLSTAIDAIGTSGWLIAGIDGSARKTEDMVNALRAEVSAGVEGCYEAQALDLYLREVDRHAALSQEKDVERQFEAQLLKDVVSADLDLDLGVRALEDVMMPMGLAASSSVTRVGVSKAKGIQSARLHKLEVLKRVGKYSIERIRI